MSPALEQPPQPLPVLHPLQEDGRFHPDCPRSWFATPCPHHPGERGKRGKPQLCTRQRCESSQEENTIERERDAWDGTAMRPDGWEGAWRRSDSWKAKARGMRHFGDVALAVFTFTLPLELRALCVGERLRKFRKAAADMALEVMGRLHGSTEALWWARSWLHPEGEDEDGHYHPHENILVPMVCWQYAGTRTNEAGKEVRWGRVHFPRRTLPRSWLGKDGWVNEEWRRRLVQIFGECPDVVVWYFQSHSKATEKIHKLHYFGRVFARWSGHEQVKSRPRALGMSHWKNRDALSQVLQRCSSLPPHDACRDCLKEGVPVDELPPRLPVVAANPEDLEKRIDRVLAAHSCPSCRQKARELPDAPYLDIRRIMAHTVGPTGPPAVETGPPRWGTWLNSTTGELRTGCPQGPGWEATARDDGTPEPPQLVDGWKPAVLTSETWELFTRRQSRRPFQRKDG